MIFDDPCSGSSVGKTTWAALVVSRPAESGVLDRIGPSSFGATSWSFPATNIWFEVLRTGMACGGDVRRVYVSLLTLTRVTLLSLLLINAIDLSFVLSLINA